MCEEGEKYHDLLNMLTTNEKLCSMQYLPIYTTCFNYFSFCFLFTPIKSHMHSRPCFFLLSLPPTPPLSHPIPPPSPLLLFIFCFCFSIFLFLLFAFSVLSLFSHSPLPSPSFFSHLVCVTFPLLCPPPPPQPSPRPFPPPPLHHLSPHPNLRSLTPFHTRTHTIKEIKRTKTNLPTKRNDYHTPHPALTPPPALSLPLLLLLFFLFSFFFIFFYSYSYLIPISKSI